MAFSRRREKGDYRWINPKQGTYRLYHGDKVVYVGQSKNIPQRIRQHEKGLKYWGSFDYNPTPGFKSKSRISREINSIRTNKPTRNIKYNR